jgi:hypothetical protein
VGRAGLKPTGGPEAGRAKRGTVDKRTLVILGLVLALAGAALATTGVQAAEAEAPGPVGLGTAGADSLRTNLWLVEALMGEIVSEAAEALPPAPARVYLTGRSTDTDPAGKLMRVVAARVLKDRGYELLVSDPDSASGVRPDCAAWFSIDEVAVSYPDVGRTLGLWRRWVDRDVSVVVTAEVSETSSGRLLLSERLARRFSDRVTNDELAGVSSKLYPFTTATVKESGWQRRLEEFAVLGTLAGLIAVYFANTGD